MSNDNSIEKQPAATTKKTYEKPSFRFEQVFVTSALSCGKMSGGTQSACTLNPKVS
jgi:hypothetical protein